MQASRVSRREFLKWAAAAAAAAPGLRWAAGATGAAGAGAVATGQRTLKIAKWAHFLPEFDSWFAGVLAKEWGERQGVKVIVDLVPVEQIAALAATEAAAGKGHDLIMYPWPPAEYQRHTIDHSEIYQAVSFGHGSIDRMGHRSTFDPKGKRYFAFADSWMPAPLHYYQDQWAEVGMPLGPLHYGSLLSGGKRLRAKLGVPCGLALAPSLESNITLLSLLHGFGSHVLDASGGVILGVGARTIAALKYVKALVEEAGAADQLAWGSAGNVQAMVARKTSCSVNAISLIRAAEAQQPEAAKQMRLSPPLVGSAGIIAVPHVTNCSAVWSFAENQADAKKFLVDMIDSSKAIYEKSRGCNLPIYQKSVPDWIVRLENDPYGVPPWKYKELKDALHWTANLGFPGFADPVSMEAFNSFVVPRMFVSVVKGEASPEEAARAADAEVKRIAEKWRQA